ncbi:FGGY-family carbohydrate kinase [Candidatus Latescibacterota bacterium]
MTILGLDVGTTGLKMGIYREENDGLSLINSYSQDYEVNIYNEGLFGDIEQEKWQKAFRDGCMALTAHMADVDVIALSGTTPGMSAMDADGNALYPAILMLDQRSRSQASHIINTVGLNKLLEETGNMPVAGGCSLASMLWIRDNHPDIFRKVHTFGHSNTFMAKWLTGKAVIDPSSASLMALYNTVRNDLTWNADIAEAFGLSVDLMPELIHSHDSPGRVLKSLANEFGLSKEPPVVIGGNDAVLAAYSVGISEPGDIINVNGTCEITLVCLPRCLSSTRYNVRAHVIPGRWLTLYVMNAGGKALEWFKHIFCGEMSDDAFYSSFLPEAVDEWLDRESTVSYVPYLMGSRYSLDPLKAEFKGLTRETTRGEMLAAMIRGLCGYQRDHLKEIGIEIQLADTICITGGANSPAMTRAKKKWMRDCDYIFEDQSSMKGAAMLGVKYLEGASGTL